MNVLVTGAAGFIGCEVSLRLLARGDEVVGIDNLNDYYDVRLKQARLQRLAGKHGWSFHHMDLHDQESVQSLFSRERFDAVVNLAAQAGVRYSLENPRAYIRSNIDGMLEVLEGCRAHPVRHLVYASSSSVYGENRKTPFSPDDRVDHPVSLYAATKKADELMAHTYSHLFGIRATGLRYFTVYGPWGRPDMAPMLFASAILAGQPIRLFNQGEMRRDFTYVDDIVEGTIRALDTPPSVADSDLPVPGVPHRVHNIGRGAPTHLLEFVELLEMALGKSAIKEFVEMQPGDVPLTWADTASLEKATGYRPVIPPEEGVKRFASWFLEWRKSAG